MASRLRDYRSSEFEEIWKLDQRCFARDIAYSRQELAHYVSNKNSICLVLDQEERIIGFILGHTDRRGFGHIVTLDVDSLQRRSGLGSRLMGALEERFRALGLSSVFLEVAVNNLPALAFYKQHGYSVLKTLRRYYPGGVDGLLMGKRFFEPSSKSVTDLDR